MRLSKLLVPMSLIFAVLIILTYMNLPNIDIGASHLKNHHHMAGFSIEHGSNTTATEQSANEEIRGNGGRAEKKSRPALNFSESELRKMVSKPPTWTEHNPCLEVIKKESAELKETARTYLSKNLKIWPSMGPSSGGKQVFILPQSQEGRSDESVYCQFGIARTRAGYDAWYDLLVCNPTPRVHKVIEGDTYANIADRYNLNLDALLNMNGVRRDAAASLRNGAIIQIQQERILVELVDSKGKRLHSEDPMQYHFYNIGVREFQPRSSLTTGGNFLTVYGRGFPTVDGLLSNCLIRCRFGSLVQVPASVISDSELLCPIVPLPTNELDRGNQESQQSVVRSVQVGVSANGMDFDVSDEMFTYYRNVVCIDPQDVSSDLALEIALVAVPKSFRGGARMQQINAIESWRRLLPKVEIILVSPEDGVKEVADQFGVKYTVDVEVNVQGTPLLSSIFRKMKEISSAEVFILVNADIILFHDIMAVIKSTAKRFNDFLIVGRRTNTDSRFLELVNKARETQDWNQLRESARMNGKEHTRWALDYFVLSRNLFQNVPDFAFGRPAYDNWFVRSVIEKGLPVVDASNLVLAIHQAHNYAHVNAKEKREAENSEEEAWRKAMKMQGKELVRDAWEKLQSEEIQKNFALAGPNVKLGTSDHTSWVALVCA